MLKYTMAYIKISNVSVITAIGHSMAETLLTLAALKKMQGITGNYS